VAGIRRQVREVLAVRPKGARRGAPAHAPGLTLGFAALLLVAACATPITSPHDPWEGFNRGVFAFNEGADTYVFEPLSKGWDFVVPDSVQGGLVNVFANLVTPLNAVNHALQAEWRLSGRELARFLTNSTLGILGIFDIAEGWGIGPRPTDFGRTLAAWGVPPGPYLVLPFFGPQTVRSTTGLAAQVPAKAGLYHAYGIHATPADAVERINDRSYYSDDLELVRRAALDLYTYVRSSYLQRRGVVVETYDEDWDEDDDQDPDQDRDQSPDADSTLDDEEEQDDGNG